MAFKEILLAALAITTTVFAVQLLRDTKAPASGKDLTAFHAYNRRHGKSHGSKEEFAYRFSIYQDNKKYIKAHNKKQSTFTLGENQFTDLTFEEFSSKYLSQRVVSNEVFGLQTPFLGKAEKVDWRQKGVVTGVKDQESCGSCWAFSATGSLESAYALANKELLEFSESELIDCSTSYGNDGCNGGLMNQAFKYVIDHKIGLESDYPYHPIICQCHRDESKRRISLKSFKQLSPLDVNGLVQNIKNTPISVAIEVQRDFQLYKSGIYTNPGNCGRRLNHGVLAVGFDTTDQTPYFIVKNSWGRYWGEQGYIRMAIGSGSGTCGIANQLDYYPIF